MPQQSSHFPGKKRHRLLGVMSVAPALMMVRSLSIHAVGRSVAGSPSRLSASSQIPLTFIALQSFQAAMFFIVKCGTKEEREEETRRV